MRGCNGLRELSRFECVVFDPPRAGARAQAEALKEAENVQTVIAVSCNPATLGRDLALLRDAFTVTDVTLIDQFIYTPHIEVVARLERRT